MAFNILAVALGGALGATLRYLAGIGVAYAQGDASAIYPFPVATFLVNVLGCFIIGLLSIAFAGDLNSSQARWKLFAITGVCGGFTTFSTFSLETVQLFDSGAWGVGILNVVITLLICIAALLAGRALGHVLIPGR